jgi:hypothetical protein
MGPKNIFPHVSPPIGSLTTFQTPSRILLNRSFPIAKGIEMAEKKLRVLFVSEDVTLEQVVRLAVLAQTLDPLRCKVHCACGSRLQGPASYCAPAR